MHATLKPAVFAGLVCLSGLSPVLALESDQFTLPPAPLADVGAELDRYLGAELGEIITALNAEIDRCRQRGAKARSASSKRRQDRALQKLLSEDRVARALHAALGKGMPQCRIERWLGSHKFQRQPARHKLDYGDSVFGGSALFKPLLVVALAPAVKVHGVCQGTDKLGHLLQQGYDYYRIYHKQRGRGRSEARALKAAVDWGVKMEKSWGGRWWTGAYSNADLAANYAGFKFYLNLTQPVKVGTALMPPLLVQRNGRWVRNESAEHMLKPFVTEHFDEAMNPGWYDGPVRNALRRGIRRRGAAWVAHYKTDRETEVARLKRLSTWYGQDYGHCGFKDAVTIVNAYFDAETDAGETRAQP